MPPPSLNVGTIQPLDAETCLKLQETFRKAHVKVELKGQYMHTCTSPGSQEAASLWKNFSELYIQLRAPLVLSYKWVCLLYVTAGRQ